MMTSRNTVFSVLTMIFVVAGSLALGPMAGAARAGQPELSERDEISTMELLRSLDGRWKGELEYSDYGSGQRVRLPAKVECVVGPDGGFIMLNTQFTDPGRIVYDTSLLTVAPGEMLTVLSVRSGSFSQYDARVTERKVQSAEEWSFITETRGRDDNRDADIRVTRALRDGRLTSTREVRFVDEGENANWVFRNEIRLDRLKGADPAMLVGTWDVDLRPTPDSAPYIQPFVVTSAENGVLEGKFYDTPIENGRFVVRDGVVHFSFTTRDGSGPYYSTGRFGDGNGIRGSTHSLGRDFFLVWSGIRRQ